MMMRRLLLASPIVLVILLIAGCGGGGGTVPAAPSEEMLSLGPLEIGIAATSGFRQLAIPSPAWSAVALTAFYGSSMTRMTQMGAGRIAFVTSSGLATIMPDGSAQNALPISGGSPAWAPNGLQLAYSSYRNGNRDIFISNADGTGEQRLTTEAEADDQPCWSPDGRQIAYAKVNSTGFDLYVMNADGTGKRAIAPHTAYEVGPDWSPDGREILFASDRDGDYEIYATNPNDTYVRQLTSNSDIDADPAWSPDGRKIVFRTNRNTLNELAVMNADGTGQVLLGVSGFSPCFSWDGREILFTRDSHLHVMRANGTGVRRVGETVSGASPSWSPVPVRSRVLVGPNGSDGGSNPPLGLTSRLAVVGMTDADGIVSASALQVANALPLTVTPMDYGGNSLAAITVSGTSLQAMIEDRGRGIPVRRWAFPVTPATGSATIFFSASNGQIRSILTSADVITATATLQGTKIAVTGSFNGILDASDPTTNMAGRIGSTVLLDGNTGRVLGSQE